MKYHKLNQYDKFLLSGLVLLFHLLSSAVNYYTPAFATSVGVVIAHVQTGGAGSGTASQELVSLYNSSSQDIEVTGWCLEYSSGSNGQNFSKLSCIQSGYENVGLWLPGDAWVHFGTLQFFEAAGMPIDFYYSAGLAGSSGHIRIVDARGGEIDRVGWGAAAVPEGTASLAHSSGQVLSRKITSVPVDTDNNLADFESVALSGFVAGSIYEQELIVDVCVNVDGIQIDVPTGLEHNEQTGTCIQSSQVEDAPLQVTELYPDAPSYDTGQEFIELYNPTERTVSLIGYVLQVGQSYTQSVTLSSGSIEAGGYIAISDLQSGVILPNTSATVRLVSPAGNVVSESAAYNAPSEQVSWALVDSVWQYSNQITPGLANLPYLEEPEENTASPGAVNSVALTPCPVGKVRNPATNRCRTVGSTQSQLLACDDGEYRSLETNRCRKLVTVAGTLTPCKAGQERNPATNRCKSAQTGGSGLAACKEGHERNPETNRCRKVPANLGASSGDGLSEVSDVAVPTSGGQYVLLAVGVTFLSIVGYLIYEWRSEIMRILNRLKLNSTICSRS